MHFGLAAAEKQFCAVIPSGEGGIGDNRSEQPGKEWLYVDTNCNDINERKV